MESKTDRQLPLRSRGYVMSTLRQIKEAAIRKIVFLLNVFIVSSIAGLGLVAGGTIGLRYIILGAGV